jgi:hypothetical protein
MKNPMEMIWRKMTGTGNIIKANTLINIVSNKLKREIYPANVFNVSFIHLSLNNKRYDENK